MTKRSFQPLSHVMGQPRPRQAVVAWRSDQRFLWPEFQSHVAGLSRELAKHPSGRWLLSCESTYAFAVGLMALWHSGRVPVLPPNQQADSVSDASKGAAGMLTDRFGSEGKWPVLSPTGFPATPGPWKPLNRTRTRLELFTSGSTGERKVISKSLDQLQREIDGLEATFGSGLGVCRVLSTVSHHHIYGLLFRLLWPLCAGRPFADESWLLWEELIAQMSPSASTCLVSSPVHLERITPSVKTALRKVSIAALFSSGGPLAELAVKGIRDLRGQPPIEVYGSTETGGVGWRQRRDPPATHDWTPFAPVRVTTRRQGAQTVLHVTSPWAGSLRGVTMGDRGTILQKGRFRIEGRVDRIVKVAEKRLSLDDMERHLQKHPLVQDSRVIPLNRMDGPSSPELGAVVRVRPCRGRSGTAKLIRLLRTHLLTRFELSTLPKRFRFVDTWPSDTQGKRSLAMLQSLFQPAPSALETWPRLVKESIRRDTLTRQLKVQPELLYLQGHFPGFPVVPGIVQVQWVIRAAREWLGEEPRIRCMEAIKFKQLLMPGKPVTLQIKKEGTGKTRALVFSLTDGKNAYSSGRLVLA